MLASRVASFSRRTAAQALSASVAGLPSWAPAAASFGLEQPRRFMGIMDRLKGMAENRQKESLDKKKQEVFKMQLDRLCTLPAYGMSEHLQLLEDIAAAAGATGWRTMLMTDAQKAELAEQLVDLKIGAALSAAERADPKLLTGKERQRLAGVVGCDAPRVNKFLDSYNQSAMIHKWLAGRKAKGFALPSTFDEYVQCMMADKVGQNQGALKRQLGKSRSTQAMLRKM